MTGRLALLFVLAFAACRGGERRPDPAAPSPTEERPASDCGVSKDPDAALTPEQCTCLGGKVRGDIGDGQIRCADGERQLGRVTIGIEGGVCCVAPTSASR